MYKAKFVLLLSMNEVAMNANAVAIIEPSKCIIPQERASSIGYVISATNA